ncbi:MAG: hypothetical protein IPJ88_16200 [Myxococcales bacterium]|nr:MAG: hypothetical protein IPJ88_16200 [Myxococcales bacterium]
MAYRWTLAIRTAAWIGLSACNLKSPHPAAKLGPPERKPSFAVVTSDYVSSAIALLDADGELITEAWIDSGTTAAGLSATIGGDVVLPSHPSEDNTLKVIDRLGIDVVTRIDLDSGQIIDQIQTQGNGPNETGFRANPQDWVQISDTVAFVSRHEPNLNPNASELDAGNDLIQIDLPAQSIRRHIDLASFNTSVGATTVYARPALMTQLGSFLIFSMARLSFDFSKAASGILGYLDLSSMTLGRLDLAPCKQAAWPRQATLKLFLYCA